MNHAVAIQVIHRIGALLVFVKVGLTVIKAFKTPVPQKIKTLAGLAAFFLSLQVSLGISAVLLKMPIFINIAHHTIAASLFATLLVMSYEANRIRLH